jgi:heat shock protein HslJ
LKLTPTLSAIALALLLAGCGTSESGADSALGQSAPTVDELSNAAYEGLEGVGQAVTLVDGRWEDVPKRLSVSLAHDFRVTGDLDGAPPDEAVVLLAESTGGSGTFNYLAVVARRDGRAVNVATAPLGDRVALRDLRIVDRQVVADVLQAGANDAMCCPGELATRTWALEAETLRELPASGATSRLSLDAIGGPTWVLRSWAFDESAPVAPEVTLEWRDGRLAGSSGCNTYGAAATAGESPGEVSIGPTMGTRMMCPDAEMQVEERFLSQLAKVRTFGFMLGQLALTYQTDDRTDVMLFERR